MERRAVSRACACIWAIACLAALAAALPVRAAPASASESVAAELGRQADALQALLDAVRDARGEPLRQDAMQRHWDAMQVYMRDSLRHTLTGPAPDPAVTPADCRLAGGAWKALSFPGQLRSDDYLRAMQARMGRMREELLVIHDARTPAALDSALQAHWRSNYQSLQRMRGLGWMFDGWKPVDSEDASLPAPESEGARLTQAFCSVCHAVPHARLHTAAEWNGVMETMNHHIVTSDTSTPLCMQVPTPDELAAIRAYLTHYAR